GSGAVDGEVARCGKALASLRRIGYEEDSAIIAPAKQDLSMAEAVARAALRPEDVFHISIDRLQQAKGEEHAKLLKSVEELEVKVTAARQQRDIVAAGVAQIEEDVEDARRALARPTPAPTTPPADILALAAQLQGLRGVLQQASGGVAEQHSAQLVHLLTSHVDSMAGVVATSKAALAASAQEATGPPAPQQPQAAREDVDTGPAATGTHGARSIRLASYNGSYWNTFKDCFGQVSKDVRGSS
ncbi:unnamed protein product, partial [Prorocentrum cordatum]